MSVRKDATYDLIMLALGAADELWSRVFDRVKAWAGEETSDEVTEAMVGWRETYEGMARDKQALWAQVAAHAHRLDGQNHRLDGHRDRIEVLETRGDAGSKILVEHYEKIAKLERDVQDLMDDVGPRISEADEAPK